VTRLGALGDLRPEIPMKHHYRRLAIVLTFSAPFLGACAPSDNSMSSPATGAGAPAGSAGVNANGGARASTVARAAVAPRSMGAGATPPPTVVLRAVPPEMAAPGQVYQERARAVAARRGETCGTYRICPGPSATCMSSQCVVTPPRYCSHPGRARTPRSTPADSQSFWDRAGRARRSGCRLPASVSLAPPSAVRSDASSCARRPRPLEPPSSNTRSTSFATTQHRSA
jgi:hypothetical protein